MGLWPTGVSVVTALNAENQPLGMVIGSFTSVSLDPALVAFCPQKSSASWREMRETKRCCINFLSEFQSDLCWRFASGNVHGRFEGLDSRTGESGVPLLDGCVAWIEVEIEQEIEAGDHWIVLCRVETMRKGSEALPMAFVQGRLSKSSPIFQLPADHLGAWERSFNLLHTS
ncbi:flavin reductase family protein [Crenobacter sp. SG2303]|uniref:Flavin reductase family protein n=2 Tax=Crenobacter oryzisoli TaxID=3056844 RepID=A0ABT7XS29_9NEIS|nr:flavin reductase family protein [Crenobacter sp. SG2303]MDN0076602.1 flavin reductase family protein [Crenobacter sp. SG2303]